MPYCVKCGSELLANAQFCASCGTAVPAVPESHRRQVFEGAIHKCPNCGEVLDSFMPECPMCGYELRGVRSASRVEELSLKLEEAETAEEKADLIRNFHIPNTKEDIYEFFILASSNINTGYEVDAWQAKLQQAYQKAELVFGEGPEMKRLRKLYKRTGKKRLFNTHGNSFEKMKLLLGIIIGACGLLMVLVGNFAGSETNDPDSPFYMMALIGMFPLIGGGYLTVTAFTHEKE
ncbi:MAG: zinc ribbon domain-containing protein [Eggerthellaceae bacterium]|nr:zinc ribbon domain-containing protein [Eggerthellaceae bacterium]